MEKLLNQSLMGVLCLTLVCSCAYDKEPAPNDCSDLAAPQLVETTTAGCGLENGSLEVEMADTESTYTFSLDGDNFQSEGIFTGLGSGNYTVTVSDGNGCTNQLAVTVPNASGFNVNPETSDSGCGTLQGSITLSVEGGEAPFEFKIGDDGDFQAESTFDGLENGEYEITAVDATGCTTTVTATVFSGIEFSVVNNIIQTNCAVSGCHDGSRSPDLRDASDISASAVRVMARTGAKTMPPSRSGLSLTDEEIENIACWVSDGAISQ